MGCSGRVGGGQFSLKHLLASLACVATLPAQADLWAFVDEAGVTHYAETQVDERYEQLFDSAHIDLLDPKADMAALEQQWAKQKKAAEAAKRLASQAVVVAGSGPTVNWSRSRGYLAFSSHLREAAQQHAIDYALLRAIVAAESGFNPNAVSPKGAVGLMQLMPATAQRYGVQGDERTSIQQKLTDPRTNIQAGVRYLKYLMRLFPGRLDLTVAAYNAGEGAVQRAGNQIPNYTETQNYVRTVLRLYGGGGG